MKKALFALAALAMPAMAGTYTVVEPANPYSMELAVGYNFAARDIIKADGFDTPRVDTIGVDLTGVYKVSDHSSFNLRFGFATGSDSETYFDDTKLKARMNNFYLMPGYRFTHRMGEYTSGFIGVNAGVINESVKIKMLDDIDGRQRYHGSEYGFAYSAEAGLRFDLSRHFDLYVAYQFFGSTAEPSIGGDDGIGTRSQLFHCVRLGVCLDF